MIRTENTSESFVVKNNTFDGGPLASPSQVSFLEEHVNLIFNFTAELVEIGNQLRNQADRIMGVDYATKEEGSKPEEPNAIKNLIQIRMVELHNKIDYVRDQVRRLETLG